MKKISINEAIEEVNEKHGGKIKIIEYLSMRSDAKFICLKCKNIWTTKAFSVIRNGTGCFNCSKEESSKNQRTSFCNLSEFLKKFYCTITLKSYSKYENIFSSVDVTFYCGHTQKITISNFNKYIVEDENIALCGKCKKKYRWEIFHKNNEKLIPKEINSLGFDFISFIGEYSGIKTKIKSKCPNGHVNIRTLSSYRMNKGCSFCNILEMGLNNIGENNPNWKGGKSEISKYLRTKIENWKRLSIKKCSGRCFVTGDMFDDIHHLYSFESIVSSVLGRLNIENKSRIDQYSKKELDDILKLFLLYHDKIPLGICLREDVHILFHQIYGSKNNTPEQFYEFVDRIKSGEIIIN